MKIRSGAVSPGVGVHANASLTTTLANSRGPRPRLLATASTLRAMNPAVFACRSTKTASVAPRLQRLQADGATAGEKGPHVGIRGALREARKHRLPKSVGGRADRVTRRHDQGHPRAPPPLILTPVLQRCVDSRSNSPSSL